MNSTQPIKQLYAFLIVFISSITYRASAKTPMSGFYAPNSTVNTIVQSGNTIYLGGAFTAIGQNYGYGGLFDAATAAPSICSGATSV